MKKFSSFLMFISIVLMFQACCKLFPKSKRCVEPDCGCCIDPPLEWTSSDNKTVKLYNAFTPYNYDFSDSIVVDTSGQPVEMGKRKNADAKWNDEVNEYFHIDGVENFHNNRLIIRVVGDTSKILNIEDYSNTSVGEQVFTGLYTKDTTFWGATKRRMLRSGKFEYEFLIFSGEADDPETDTLADLISTFCIIRNKVDCPVENCVGKDPNDPLLR